MSEKMYMSIANTQVLKDRVEKIFFYLNDKHADLPATKLIVEKGIHQTKKAQEHHELIDLETMQKHGMEKQYWELGYRISLMRTCFDYCQWLPENELWEVVQNTMVYNAMRSYELAKKILTALETTLRNPAT